MSKKRLFLFAGYNKSGVIDPALIHYVKSLSEFGDIALVMDKDKATYDVVRTIQKASKRMLTKTTIFDVYEGEHIEEGKKSVAFGLTFQDPTKTMDEATINNLMKNILEAVEKEHKAVLRG